MPELPTGDKGNGAAVATTILVIGEGASLFAAFCPSWFTVRSDFFNDQGSRDGNVAAIRQGEIAGTLSTMLVGFGASIMTGSSLPLYGAAIVCGVMVAGYEYSIAHPAAEKEEEGLGQSPGLAAWRYRAAQ